LKIVGVIATTNFGRVERVQLTDSSVAARKVFSPSAVVLQDGTTEKMRKRFAREVRIQAELPKLRFIPILQWDLDADPPWFVMPLADMTLGDYLPSLKDTANLPQLLGALDHILDSLEQLHSLGLVHRDLKPSNILLHEGRWKLSDLGLVLPLQNQSTKLTSEKSSWFTLDYCAPEQYAEFRSATPAVDIYAFGCILHDVFGVAQRAPFQRATAPGAIGHVIEKCTEVDPRKRFKSLTGLRAALFGVLAAPPKVAGETKLAVIATDWGSKLQDVHAMTDTEIIELARFLRNLAHPFEAHPVFVALNEERLAALKARDADAYTEIAMQVCEWAKGGFDFEYCDVVIGRLLMIYESGSVELKASAAIAAAELGASHNRWFVMGRVLAMCGPKTEENVVQRIVIEIRASELEEQFRKCAYVISQPMSVYHALIAAALSEVPPPPPPN
jgi:eukaryotic-like serine/threonine-protein kinase